MAKLIRRFLALPYEEKRSVPVLVILLAAARLSATFTGVPRARRWLRRLAFRARIAPERLAELISAASSILPGATLCLPRSLVLEAVLCRSGRPAELRIGLAPRAGRGRPEAHAWVELDGSAVGENPSRYTALPLFGAQA